MESEIKPDSILYVGYIDKYNRIQVKEIGIQGFLGHILLDDKEGFKQLYPQEKEIPPETAEAVKAEMEDRLNV